MKELEERKAKLEANLLKNYALKEQKLVIFELQGYLKIKASEVDMMNTTINSLQDERKRLQEEIAKGVLAKKQLERERNRIKGLQRQIEINAKQTMDGLLMLKQQVTSLQLGETTTRDAEIDARVKAVGVLELEVLELRRRNKELHLEKRDLAIKLVDTEARLTSLPNMTEGEVVAEVREEINNLRHVNDALSNQVEKLQKSRFSIVEELVYQQWINACLRYEIQRFQTPSRRTSNGYVRKSLSSISREGVKETFSDYTRLNHKQSDVGVNRDSAQSSSSEGDEFDNVATDISASRRGCISKKPGVLQKKKRWRRSRDDSSDISSSSSSLGGTSSSWTSLSRRSSMSTGPEVSIVRNECDSEGITETGKKKQLETPNPPRNRRVSFSGSLNSELESVQIQGVLEDKHPAYKDWHKLAVEIENAIRKADKPRAEAEMAHDSLNFNSSSSSEAELEREKNNETDEKCKDNHTEKHDRRTPELRPNKNKKAEAHVDFSVTLFLTLLLMLVLYYLLLVAVF